MAYGSSKNYKTFFRQNCFQVAIVQQPKCCLHAGFSKTYEKDMFILSMILSSNVYSIACAYNLLFEESTNDRLYAPTCYPSSKSATVTLLR